MKKLILNLIAFGIVTSSLSSAAVLKFQTVFAPEAMGATGSGTGYFEFDTTSQTLLIDVNWSGLSGVTTVAHIHCCTATAGTGTVGVAVTPGTLPGFPVGVTSGVYNTVLNLSQDTTFTDGFRNAAGGTALQASDALLQGILNGKAYFNIHSSTFPAGEIRDFLAPVPEPGTMLLVGVALAGLVAARRLRSI